MGPAMPRCGFASDWSLPVPKEATEGSVAATARPEPRFEPGIPGLRMVDVRDHKFLWREIDELQIWERGERISVAELRAKAIEKTAHFLELEGAAADDFEIAAFAAIEGLRKAFFERQARPGTSGIETFTSHLREAETDLSSLLHEAPRHQLFAPRCKKWLLKLAFGPREGQGGQGNKTVAGFIGQRFGPGSSSLRRLLEPGSPCSRRSPVDCASMPAGCRRSQRRLSAFPWSPATFR